jgi:hypothetical protein
MMKAQTEFGTLIVIITILACVFVIFGVLTRQNEVTLITSLVKNVVQTHGALEGKAVSVDVEKSSLNSWKIYIILEKPITDLSSAIGKAVVERFNCNVLFTDTGLDLDCPYNRFEVIV